MNAEIIKAMNRKDKKHPVRNWWIQNGYKVARVVLFPIWIWMWALGKINSKLNARTEWSDERANEILNYYIPRASDWNEENQELYFFDNGYGWTIGLAKKYLKFKDRRFWCKFNGMFGGQIREYLMNTFELEGFTKELGDCSDGWTEISFKKNEERA